MVQLTSGLIVKSVFGERVAKCKKPLQEAIQKFREEFIVEPMLKKEIDDNNMMTWLGDALRVSDNSFA